MGMGDDLKRGLLKKAVDKKKAETEVSTTKGGEFHVKGNKDVPLPFPQDDKGKDEKITIQIWAKLLKPTGISIEGEFTFNGVKRKFAGKSGERKLIGEFELKPKNTTNLDGKTNPAQADGTKLKVEIETVWVD